MTSLFFALGPTSKPAKAAAQQAAASDGSGIVLALGALGVLIVLGLVAYVFLRVTQKKDDREFEQNKFSAPREWSWEQSLSEAEEGALLQGLKSWENPERSLYINHEDGTLTLYLPRKQAVISLFLLTEKLRQAGAFEPASVAKILDDLAFQEQPGVICFSQDWFAPGVLDDMDNDAFLAKVRDTLTAGFDAGLPGSNGWYSDENYGRIDLRIIAEVPPEVQRLQDEDRFDRVPMAESRAKNVFLFNAAPLVGRYQKLRAEQPALSPEEAIRTLLHEALSRPSTEHTWSRVKPSETEQRLLHTSAGVAG